MPDIHSIHGQGSLVVAVGDAGTIWHFTDSTFSIPPRATTADLSAVHIRHPADGWAVGEAGTLLRWNGTAWSPIDSGTTEDLLAVACASPTDAWIGGRHTLLHWSSNGAGITHLRTDTTIHSIYIDAAEQIYCLCAGREVHRFDGTHWHNDLLPGDDDDDEFYQLAGSGSGPVYAVGLRGQVRRFDGTRWHVVPIDTDDNLSGAACSGPAGLWLTTTTGQLLRWDGEHVQTCAASPFGWLGAVCAPAEQDAVYAAGKAGTVLRHRPSPDSHHP